MMNQLPAKRRVRWFEPRLSLSMLLLLIAVAAVAIHFRVRALKERDFLRAKGIAAKAAEGHENAAKAIEQRMSSETAELRNDKDMIASEIFRFIPTANDNMKLYVAVVDAGGISPWWKRWIALERRAARYYAEIAAGRVSSKETAVELATEQRHLLSERLDIDARLAAVDGLEVPVNFGAVPILRDGSPERRIIIVSSFFDFMINTPDFTQPGRALGETVLVDEAKLWEIERAKALAGLFQKPLSIGGRIVGRKRGDSY